MVDATYPAGEVAEKETATRALTVWSLGRTKKKTNKSEITFNKGNHL